MKTLTPVAQVVVVNGLIDVLKAVIETIKESGPEGAPAGVLYVGLQTAGCTLAQFEQVMSIVVGTGRVRKSGQLYFFVQPSP